jgi:hypothetical protein
MAFIFTLSSCYPLCCGVSLAGGRSLDRDLVIGRLVRTLVIVVVVVFLAFFLLPARVYFGVDVGIDVIIDTTAAVCLGKCVLGRFFSTLSLSVTITSGIGISSGC